MSHISEFLKEEGQIKHQEGCLIYYRVTPIFEEGDTPAGFVPKGSNFLYDDYSVQLKPGDVFYEIVKVEVEEYARRRGVGSQLVKEFFSKCNPTSVVLRAGITSEALYTQLHKNKSLSEYIHKNIVPFYEYLGFTDVNHTTFELESSVPMLWPKSKADEAKRIADEWRQKMDKGSINS